MGVMNGDNPNLVKAALDGGMRLLDTAHYYMRGRNEEIVGQAVKGRPRDSFILASKARASTVDRSRVEGGEEREETTESFIQKVEISLKRLQMDYIDILYLHSAKSKQDALKDHVLEAMQKLKQSGKIRFIGISTHSNEPEVIRAAVESGLYEVVLTAYNFRMKHRAEVKAAIAEAAKAGLGIVAMKTQAGVYFDQERKQPINMMAALKWALQDENVHTSVPGFTTFDQLEADLAVMRDPALSTKEKADLKLGLNHHPSGMYCQQCGACEPQCKKSLDIPRLMRSYMYAHGYRNLELAKDTVLSANLPEAPCGGCDVCGIECTMGFDIKNRIENIARIRQVPDDFII
jgi:predicted aldo/keto reductase-like oxidoreductase